MAISAGSDSGASRYQVSRGHSSSKSAGEASIYVLMFLVLLVRPRGLLGERIEKFE